MLSGLTQYVPEATLTVYDNLEFLIRLLLSAALGALVGLERSKRRKEAGIRTHCIIACTSALFMIVSNTLSWTVLRWMVFAAPTLHALPPRWSAAYPFWVPVSYSKRQLYPRTDHRRRYVGYRRHRYGCGCRYVLAGPVRGGCPRCHPDHSPPLPCGGGRPHDTGNFGGAGGYG